MLGFFLKSCGRHLEMTPGKGVVFSGILEHGADVLLFIRDSRDKRLILFLILLNHCSNESSQEYKKSSDGSDCTGQNPVSHSNRPDASKKPIEDHEDHNLSLSALPEVAVRALWNLYCL